MGDIKIDIKNDIKKLYLTYNGLMRVLFVSRNKHAILHNNGGYEEKIDYKYFDVTSPLNYGMGDIKNDIKNDIKKLYLTYNGLVRVLFVSRNKHVNRFQEWAMERLFVVPARPPRP
jgi:hypothetical protein